MAANRRSTVGSLNEVDGPRGLLSYGYNAFSTIYHTGLMKIFFVLAGYVKYKLFQGSILF
ncbi:unnamed protein product [Anisakis simplex]|uniref:Proton-dependent oligopeptide transporter family n=1 Tax=Anisakis simplex TaxID=6269 RepID=A0A0M3JEC5_ANISI|nr:unnamed protein product [Anisakis simplex]